LYLSAPLLKFYHGDYSGIDSIKTLKKYGDFGLGTFDCLDGEMIVKDGVFYQVKADGVVCICSDKDTAPYTQLAFFRSNMNCRLHMVLQFSDFEKWLDAQLPSLADNFAIRVTGTFKGMSVRSVRRQGQPFPALEEAIKSQAIFELGDIEGTLIGFRLSSEFLDETNWPNYHFHFLSTDKKSGGHVLDYSIVGGLVEIMKLESLKVGNTE
jgi:acetolactate decarboxylase